MFLAPFLALYSGEAFDFNINQQYLRARWYNAANGRFNRLDPFFGNLDEPQSLHKYLYVHGDPVNGVDPNGQFIVSLGIAVLNSTVLRNSDTKLSLSVQAAATHSIYRAALVASLRVYDIFFATLGIGSAVGSLGFWVGQGPLSGKIASIYSARGFLGAMKWTPKTGQPIKV